MSADPHDRSQAIRLSDELLEEIHNCRSRDDWPDWLRPSTMDSRVVSNVSEEVGRYAVASNPISRDDVVVRTNGTLITRPHRWSIQIDEELHVTGPDTINHVCAEPNLVVEPETKNFVARRDISEGEEITINYLTFEYEMSCPFQCRCGQSGCCGRIQGFTYLCPEKQQQILLDLPVLPHLRRFM